MQAQILYFYCALLAIAVAVFGWRVLASRNSRVSVAYDESLSARGRRVIC